MKFAYIYQEGKNLSKANIYQSYSMVKALAEFHDVSWYRGFSKFKDLNGITSLRQRRVINIAALDSGISFMEKLSRVIFCLNTLLLLKLTNHNVVVTRDFAFIYFYSKVPRWLKFKSKLVYESHKIMSEVSAKVSKRQEVSAYAVVDLFLTVSNGIKQDLNQSFGIPNERIKVLPNGFDPTIFGNTDLQRKRKKPYQFIYAGSFEKWKGVDTILQAVQLASNSSSLIHIVGGSKSQFDKLSKEMSNKKLEHKVYLSPSIDREDLFQLFKTMDVGLVSTIAMQEGAKYTSPVKFFEYVNAGLLVLSSDISPMLELRDKGFYIEFYEAGSSESLNDAINRICANGIDPEKILSNKRLISEYSWTERARKIIDFVS
jgi:glycosyltransferase involved in cell wall biosynthesis